MTTKHRFALAMAAAVSLLSVGAYAQPPLATHVGEEGNRKFPMPAAEFRQHVSARLEKARSRMEEHITSDKLPSDQADGLRANFKAAAAQINAKVDQVTADGTVTQEEADAVHGLVRSLLHHGHEK
jgi:hypothetical protein